MQIGTLATPSRPKKGRLTPTAPETHLGEVMYDERPGGVKMPILHPDGNPVRKGHDATRTGKVEEFRRYQQNSNPS